MKSLYIDTNVILRLLLEDHPINHKKAEGLFKEGQKGNVKLILIPEVIFEVCYVLRNKCGYTREAIGEVLSTLVATSYVELFHLEKELVLLALKIYSNNNIDIVDSILLALSKSTAIEVFSFDKDLKKNIFY